MHLGKTVCVIASLLALHGCAETKTHEAGYQLIPAEPQNIAWFRYGARVSLRTATQTNDGSGVWVSERHILTAAHVVDAYKTGDVLTASNGQYEPSFPVKLVKIGNRASNDLALLTVIEDSTSAFKKEISVAHTCRENPAPGRWVKAVASGVVNDTALAVDPPFISQYKDQRSTSHTTGVFPPGASGGGVFDAYDNCLIGIISGQKTSGTSIGNRESSIVYHGTVFMDSREIDRFLAQ